MCSIVNSPNSELKSIQAGHWIVHKYKNIKSCILTAVNHLQLRMPNNKSTNRHTNVQIQMGHSLYVFNTGFYIPGHIGIQVKGMQKLTDRK